MLNAEMSLQGAIIVTSRWPKDADLSGSLATSLTSTECDGELRDPV